MTIKQIIQKFKDNPVYLTNGAGFLSKKWNCNKGDIYEAKRILKKESNEEVKRSAKILIFDIETSPILAQVWNVNKVFINPEQILRDRMIITWAAKWLNEKEVMSDSWKNHNIHANTFDDFEVVESLWHLLDEADIVVAHNGRAFDTKMVNTRMLKHGLPVPSPYKVVDTLNIAKQNFNFTYNRLNYLLKFLDKDGKMSHEGFNLWKRCMDGDNEAWDIMLDYNIKDVIELEKIYLELRSWDSRHPSVSIFNEDPSLACTKCGSHTIEYIKDTYTNTRVYKLYKCEECGSYSRSRTSENKLTALMTQ